MTDTPRLVRFVVPDGRADSLQVLLPDGRNIVDELRIEHIEFGPLEHGGQMRVTLRLVAEVEISVAKSCIDFSSPAGSTT